MNKLNTERWFWCWEHSDECILSVCECVLCWQLLDLGRLMRTFPKTNGRFHTLNKPWIAFVLCCDFDPKYPQSTCFAHSHFLTERFRIPDFEFLKNAITEHITLWVLSMTRDLFPNENRSLHTLGSFHWVILSGSFLINTGMKVGARVPKSEHFTLEMGIIWTVTNATL